MKYSIATLSALAWTVTQVQAASPLYGQSFLEAKPPPPPALQRPPLALQRPPLALPALPAPPPSPLRPRRPRPALLLDQPPLTDEKREFLVGSPYYIAEVNAAIATQSSATLKTKSAAVAKIPNFTWFDTADKVPTLSTYLADAQSQSSKSIVQIVVYDLPDRDCHAKASNGEYHIANNGVALYKAYVDSIASAVSAYPGVRVVAVVEPDSLANLVTNMSDSHCANAHDAYLQCTTYVLQKLNQCNIWLYLDAGHAGWLGWQANQDPAAQLFAQVYKSATPNRVRGLATNVANYNALHATTPDPITQGNPCVDELSYVQALGPKLASNGFPAHFIIDQGRSGQQNLRGQWGDWCNIKGAGFGMRPTTSTPDPMIDAIVWVKPGGECDGTSDSSSPRYDSTCSLSDAKQPAPEAGSWFEAYFEDLVNNANPAL
ncbi:Beta-glucosidase cel3A [Tulasnella sp. 424]|nr:Beta-glucosidase cel3A [Tulasnella sp. 424]